MTDFTPNFSFKLIDFNIRPWSDDEHSNWNALDRILGTMTTNPNQTGAWTQGRAYAAGNIALDVTNQLFYSCLVAHTAPMTGTFSDARTANPTYWQVVNQNTGNVRYDTSQGLSSGQQTQAISNIFGTATPWTSSNNPFSTNLAVGQQKFASGLILQWGQVGSSGSDPVVTFTQFPTGYLFAQASPNTVPATGEMYQVSTYLQDSTHLLLARRRFASGSVTTGSFDVSYIIGGY